MRDLKFRFWDKEEDRYWDERWCPMCGSSLYNTRDDNFIAEQYTGLKDKNGTEIYEGDIILTQHNNYPVEWDDTEAMFKAETGMAYLSVYSWGRYEVIGNIHENKELLDG
jgi:uncharacterized phage protein (TIGR01671 family)